ncbi:MAG: ABC transporter permease subunit [Gemmataceae bacterium]|nr:ABC transporter permease subunit [Gemmataceae bacterium]
MTRVLLLKLLRDVRWTLLGVGLLVGLFQFLWALITARILGKITPFFVGLAGLGGLTRENIEKVVFDGPGRVLRTIIGGEGVTLDNAMDMLSIGFVHPVMQIVFCIWAIGRAAGAIAGEIDKGTMELLLAQPLARARLVWAHFLVDLITIPALCLAMWAGCWLGYAAVHPIKVDAPDFDAVRDKPARESPAAALAKQLEGLARLLRPTTEASEAQMRARLEIDPWRLGRGLPAVAALVFAICGLTMWLSSMGRYRLRTLTLAIAAVLLMFLVNVLGQMWGPAEWARPLTVFHYFQPQALIKTGAGAGSLLVLLAVGLAGYGMALWTFVRRDLPAPL